MLWRPAEAGARVSAAQSAPHEDGALLRHAAVHWAQSAGRPPRDGQSRWTAVVDPAHPRPSELRATIRAASGLAIIDHTDDGYRLHDECLDTDLWRLHTAAHHAATTLTDPAWAWQTVIDTYTGDLAAGHTWPWIDSPREATRRLVIDAYAAAAAAQDDPHRALELLQAGIRVDPYNENLHRRAIDILTALGDHDAAARLRDTYRHRLRLAGVHPSRTLHQILQPSNAPTGR